MDVKDAILNRCSVRSYTDDDVSDETINELLDAARLAPSGNNAQSWRFKIIRKKDYKELEGLFPQSFVLTAPIIIVCCADPYCYKSTSANDDENNIKAVRDLSIATAFMTLRAEELNLGSCYIGWVDKDKLKEILKIPKEYVLPYVLSVGYPKEKHIKKKKEIQEILF